MSGAVEAGEIELTSDLSTEVSFFISHYLGQLMLIRCNVAPEVVESAATTVLGHLEHLRSRA